MRTRDIIDEAVQALFASDGPPAGNLATCTNCKGMGLVDEFPRWPWKRRLCQACNGTGHTWKAS